MRLDTKEKRLQARQFYYREGMTVIDMPEIDFQAFISDEPEHYTLKYFIGTAGKPRENYYYRTKEKRDEALQKAIDAQKRHLEYKAQQKQENKGKLTGAAATAAAIRARLKKEFPGVKFSVTSKNFSMGNSVDIDWTDGPFYDQVNDITYQYCYGRFDGQQDLSYNVDIDPALGCPGSKFVSCHRRLSPEYKAKIKEVLESRYIPDQWGDYAPWKWTEAEMFMLGIPQKEEVS